MKIIDAINRLRAWHEESGDFANIDPAKTCDTIKCGDPEAELTGIAVTCAPTWEVVKKAAEAGCNLIFCHEPSFYSHMDDIDWLAGDPVFEQKMALIKEKNIVIYRTHDALHAHTPDGIYNGVMHELGWEPYSGEWTKRPLVYNIPPKTIRELGEELKEKIGMTGIKVIGCTEGVVSKVAYLGGGNLSFDNSSTKLMMGDVEVLICGELIDWTVTSYVNDAAKMGHQKTILHIGHFNSELLGMKYLTHRIREQNPEVPVQFIATESPYSFI